MFCFLILAEPSWKDYGNHGGKWTSRSYPIILGEAVMKAVLIPLKSQKLVKPRKKGKVKKKKKRKAKSKTEPTVKVLIFTRILGTNQRQQKQFQVRDQSKIYMFRLEVSKSFL